MAVVLPDDSSARVTLTSHALRRHAKRIRREMAAVGVTLTTAASQETLARVFGFKNWHEADRMCQAANRKPDGSARASADPSEPKRWFLGKPSGETMWTPDPHVDTGVGLLEWLLYSAAEGWTEWSFGPDSPIVGHGVSNEQGKTLVPLSTVSLSREHTEALLSVLNEGKPLPHLQDEAFSPNHLAFSSKHQRRHQRPVQLQVWAWPVMHAQAPAWTVTVRAIPQVPPQAESLGVPAALLDLARTQQEIGLWVFGGFDGSGRSTTLAALLRERLQGALKHPRAKVLVTESPRSYDWRALAPDRASFTMLAKDQNVRDWSLHVARLDQDLVVVGETRDADTLEAELRLAMGGTEIWTQAHGEGVARLIHRLCSDKKWIDDVE
jgi:hypothetical protein